MTALLLDILLKVTAVLVAAIAITALLRHRSAAARHWVLTVSILCALALPALVVVAPAWQLPSLALTPGPGGVTDTVTFTALTQGAAAAAESTATDASWATLSTGTILLGLWASGTALAMLSIASGLARLRAVSRAARPGPPAWNTEARRIEAAYGIGTPVSMRESDRAALLLTWGARRPEVLLPADAASWPVDRIRSAAAHELAHVVRGDWTIQLVAEVFRALFWFHPLCWLVVNRLRLEAEQACDDRVLAMGVVRTDYASHLIAIAREFQGAHRPWFPAPAIDRPSTLHTRIRAMLNTQLDRRPLGVAARLATALCLALTTVSLAGATRQPTASITGTVFDPTGRPVPGVTLTIADQDRPFRAELKSGDDGGFEFAGLRAGRYQLGTALPGFQPTTTSLTVDEAGTVHHPITLAVGTLQETINVAGPAVPSNRRMSVPRPAPAPCTPTATGGRIIPPRKVRDVRPAYPAGGVTAPVVVTLEARIGFDGTIAGVRATAAAPEELVRAASDAVEQWEFTPTLLNCEPVEVLMHVTTTFSPPGLR